MKGPYEVSGTAKVKIEADQASFITSMTNVGRLATEAVVKLGDACVRSGGLNRSGRKDWRKARKRLVGKMRREDARALRDAYGLASF